MSVNLYFVRHGQSVANLQDFFYNDEDAPLTPLGREQARETGRRLKELGVHFDVVYCSTYERARETCRLALIEMGLKEEDVIIDRRLEERKFDGLVGKTASEEHYRELFDYYSNRAVVDGVEPIIDLEMRAQDFLDYIKQQYDGKNVLAFSHGHFLVAVFAIVYGRPESGDYNEIRLLNNGEILEVTI